MLDRQCPLPLAGEGGAKRRVRAPLIRPPLPVGEKALSRQNSVTGVTYLW
jgi:hypothetical protein